MRNMADSPNMLINKLKITDQTKYVHNNLIINYCEHMPSLNIFSLL
jgi:hypothetical protein